MDDITATIDDLRSRIQRLELERDSYRKGRVAWRMAFGAVVALAAFGFTTTGVKDTVKVHRVEIVDRLGEVRGVLEPNGIRWTAQLSKHAVSLAPISGLYVMDYYGDTIGHLGGAMGGELRLRSAANKSGVYMSAGVLEEIDGSLAIQGKNGEIIVQLPPEPVTR